MSRSADLVNESGHSISNSFARAYVLRQGFRRPTYCEIVFKCRDLRRFTWMEVSYQLYSVEGFSQRTLHELIKELSEMVDEGNHG